MLSHFGTQSRQFGSHKSVQLTFSYLAYLVGHVDSGLIVGSAGVDAVRGDEAGVTGVTGLSAVGLSSAKSSSGAIHI